MDKIDTLFVFMIIWLAGISIVLGLSYAPETNDCYDTFKQDATALDSQFALLDVNSQVQVAFQYIVIRQELAFSYIECQKEV